MVVGNVSFHIDGGIVPEGLPMVYDENILGVLDNGGVSYTGIAQHNVLRDVSVRDAILYNVDRA